MSRSVACNLETGICEVNIDLDISKFEYKAPVIKDKILVEYFTDPLCSACFAFDATLEAVKEMYGEQIEFKNVLGGMMPKDELPKEQRAEMADNIVKMGEAFNMPMSGELMRENPVSSSYPPSLAYLAIRKQDEELSDVYLRRLREAVYVEDRDISKEAVLVELVEELGLNSEQFLIDFYSPEILDEFEENMAYTVMNGVQGFPSVVVYGLDGQGMIIRGVTDIGIFNDVMSKHGLEVLDQKEYTIDNVLESNHYLSLREIYDRLDVYFDDTIEKQLRSKEDVIVKPVNDGYYFRSSK